LRELLLAYQGSTHSGLDLWQFAVERERLHALGLSNADLRWLMNRGYVKHACETTQLESRCRTFRPCASLALYLRSAFVLDQPGVELARSLLLDLLPEAKAPAWSASVQDKTVITELPLYDEDQHALWFAGQLVKHFRHPAPHQEAVCRAFAQTNWSRCIANPLAGPGHKNRKRCLRETIKHLNENQLCALLWFRGDGTGAGVCWEARSTTLPHNASQCLMVPQVSMSAGPPSPMASPLDPSWLATVSRCVTAPAGTETCGS
jgi:hypothetical protein